MGQSCCSRTRMATATPEEEMTTARPPPRVEEDEMQRQTDHANASPPAPSTSSSCPRCPTPKLRLRPPHPHAIVPSLDRHVVGRTYADELFLKTAFAREQFPEIGACSSSSSFQVRSSPEKHFRFRTTISVLPNRDFYYEEVERGGDHERVVPARWMRAVYDNDVAERRRIERTEGGLGGETDLQEFDAAGIASADISPAAGPREAARLQAIRHVAKRHFVLFDASAWGCCDFNYPRSGASGAPTSTFPQAATLAAVIEDEEEVEEEDVSKLEEETSVEDLHGSRSRRHETRDAPRRKPHLVVRATEPERMPLETLSEPMLRLLSDRGFLDHVAELMPGTRRMRGWNLKLHSTVAGALCVQFVFDLSEAGICEWSEAFPARRRAVEEVAPKDEDVPLHVHPIHGGGSCPLERLAELYPDVRFVATAKKVCKMAVFRRTGGRMETLSSNEAEGITQSDVIKRCVLHEELTMRDVVEDEDLSLDTAAAGAGEVGRRRQAQWPPPAQVGCDTTHICRYEQVLGSFSNPNPHIAIATAEWLRYVVRKSLRKNDVEGRGPPIPPSVTASRQDKNNLLELYCGVGSHTVALGGGCDSISTNTSCFDTIVAVELDRNLEEMLRRNVQKNPERLVLWEFKEGPRDDEATAGANKNRTSVLPVRAPSAKFCRQIMKRRQYKDICLNWVLVDPPREGLDEITRQLVAQFDHVLYVSCSPTSLRRDLDFFLHDKGSHTLQEFCVLDHFPFTAHIENAVYLRAKKLAAKEQASGGA